MGAVVLGNLGHSVLEWPTGVTVHKPEKCANGYTLFSLFFSPVVYLIDMAGRVVHLWGVGTGQVEPGNSRMTYHAKYTGEGRVLISVSHRPISPPDQGLREVDWDGNILWEYGEYPLKWHHHDFQRLPNGNTLMLYSRNQVFADFSDIEARDDSIVEVTPDKRVVWEWHTMDHLDEFGYGDEARELMRHNPADPTHANTVEVLPRNPLEEQDSRFAAGNILISQRQTSTIAIIEKATGKVVWHWGPGILLGQHHPNMLPNGHILIYDNGGTANYPPEHRFWTRVLEMNPLTEELVWEYSYPPNTTSTPTSERLDNSVHFLSPYWGSAQRLSNGNTLSLDANGGRLFEVTPDGEIVWEFVNPHMGLSGKASGPGIYRVYRIPYDAVPMAPPLYRASDGHEGGPVHR